MKKLKIEFYNSFTKDSLGDIIFPLNRIKMTNGWYSKFCMNFKKGLSNLYNMDIRHVKTKIKLQKS